MVKVSVAGASGYSGGELLRWLLCHPAVELSILAGGGRAGEAVGEVFPNLRGQIDTVLETPDWQRMGAASDIVFLGLPHGLALEAAEPLLESGARVIDIGADFRLRDPAEYQQWYGLEHTAQTLLREATYGLTEHYREAIRESRLVACPGCYPTASAMALLPILEVLGERADLSIVVDAKSGVSGAGRQASQAMLFGEVNESVRPYKVNDHRHAPEIEQTLAQLGRRPRIFFAPHLIPMTRGILAACYVRAEDPPSRAELLEVMRARYAGEPFVRVLEALPETKATYGSNFCDVSVVVDQKAGVVCALAAIDNLVKGAAGQAIQNMNVMLGIDERTGLEARALWP